MAQINKPTDYFNTLLYTGDGATSTAGTTARTLTGVGFQPDWVWVKERSNTEQHFLQDAVRGASKVLASNTTSAEADVLTDYTDGGINGFVSDGFTLGSGTAGNANNINTNTETYVAWNWLGANGTASNTDGSITSTVSASTVSGFSIVSWTGNATAGATIGHGLGSVPKMIIVRNRTDVEDWVVYHGANTSAPETDYLVLNLTNATGDSSGVWNDTAPTSSVFSVGTANSTNGSSDNMIAYCFAEKKGFSKFGSYTGNGNADGSFIYLGFKPAFVIIKRTDTTADWLMHDNKRIGYNPENYYFQANLSDSEGSVTPRIDFLSNGFKLKTTSTAYNASGGTYIYMCFAESPLVGTNNTPAVAR